MQLIHIRHKINSVYAGYNTSTHVLSILYLRDEQCELNVRRHDRFLFGM